MMCCGVEWCGVCLLDLFGGLMESERVEATKHMVCAKHCHSINIKRSKDILSVQPVRKICRAVRVRKIYNKCAMCH
eukprot:6447626-Lingulodinium_polyedra.AAC.1